ncbi:hypothetical protein Gohar_000274, partial [Gossypium harknessii]|nr:hypothetical protein [Gossypium harknessii]
MWSHSPGPNRYQSNISHDSWSRNNQTLYDLQCVGGENEQL